ncbi:MAG: hypothetical protein EOO43_07080 [Flavobacterium sp.]|nr:MAG: hypothetical protein EOO43_07080 [Flavobacterium sp.]
MDKQMITDEVIFDELTNSFLYKKHHERLLTIHMLVLLSQHDKTSLYYTLAVDLLFEQLKLSYSKSIRKEYGNDQELTDLATYINLLNIAQVIQFDGDELYQEFASRLYNLEDFRKVLCLSTFRKEELFFSSSVFWEDYCQRKQCSGVSRFYHLMILFQLSQSPYHMPNNNVFDATYFEVQSNEEGSLSKVVTELIAELCKNSWKGSHLADNLLKETFKVSVSDVFRRDQKAIFDMVRELVWPQDQNLLMATFFILNLGVNYE